MGLLCSFTPEDVGFPREVVEYASDGTIVSQEIDYSGACKAFVDTFLSISRSEVPVDTGYLKSTLKSTTDGWNVEAITICEYAQYVEYGTTYCRAQPYFEPAVEAAFEVFCEEAEQAYNEAYESVMAEIEDIESGMEGGGLLDGIGPGARMGGKAGGMMGAMAGNILDWSFGVGDMIAGAPMSMGGTIIGGGIGFLGLALFFPLALGIYGLGQELTSGSAARDAIPRNQRVHGWAAYEGINGGIMPQIEII